MYFIQHCFIRRQSDSTVSENAGIEPRTVVTSTLTVRPLTSRLDQFDIKTCTCSLWIFT